MERVREVKVTIEVDTNKNTSELTLHWARHNDEPLENFLERIKFAIEELMPS